MANSILSGINTMMTPQNQQAHPDQVLNAAGGYTFEVTLVERLMRFLTLGTESGTYHTSPYSLTRSNFESLKKLAATDHKTAVDTVVAVSVAGRAPRQSPTLFALAYLCSHGEVEERAYALAQLNKVARTGTMLFEFLDYAKNMRGRGPALKRAVQNWYFAKGADKAAFQSVKYRQRGGMSHRDVLRLVKPKTADSAMNSVFKWATRGETDESTPKIIEGFLKAQKAETGFEVARLVHEYGLTWEMLPDHALSNSMVWEAMIETGIGQTALIRQLPRLTRLGVLGPMSKMNGRVASLLVDTDRLKAGRVHPVNVLIAQRTYTRGEGHGGRDWTPVTEIVDALDYAFYAAFGAVEPTNKRYMLAIDVSGSMVSPILDQAKSKPNKPVYFPITAREAAAAMALVTMSTEPNTMAVGFTSKTGFGGYSRHRTPVPQVWDGLTQLNLSPRQRLDDATEAISHLPFGGTDATLPIQFALEKNIGVDVFAVYTDNETWASPSGHAHEWLVKYRRKTGIDAKLVVVGLTATENTIADPNDPGSLNVAGFDAALPNLIADFVRG